jgi:hypothetical protein
MSKWELKYFPERVKSPVSYWVHKGVNEEQLFYQNCVEFEPEFPSKDPVKGFPFLIVRVLSVELQFASMYELEHVIEILSMKHLPTTIELSDKRGTGYGPNNHWLSRLPGEIKSYTKREKIVKALIKAKDEIVKGDYVF